MQSAKRAAIVQPPAADCGLVQILHGTHEADTEMSCLCFSRDDHTLLSRGCDNTLKVCLVPAVTSWGAGAYLLPLNPSHNRQAACVQFNLPQGQAHDPSFEMSLLMITLE